MKVALIFLAAFIATAAASCSNPPSEAAMGVAGMGYKNGRYYKLMGGIAGSKRAGRVAAVFKIRGRRNRTMYQFAHFNFRNKTAYFAYGRSKDSMKCMRIPMTKAKSLKCLCPKMWPNHRVVANTTLTSRRVPISVHCGKFRKGNVRVKIGGLFDDRCVPILVKKRYCKGRKRMGGALVFFGLHEPKAKYLRLPSICRNAKMYKPKRGAGKCPSAGNKVPRPL